MPIGGGNPLPFQVGGGPTPTEEAYDALKTAVGVGNSAEDPDTTIIEAWRFAKARGFSAVGVEAESVALQAASPDNATDLIPMYERLLQLFFPVDTPDETRRVALLAEWVKAIDAVHQNVDDALQAIDATIIFQIPDRDELRETQPGRYFEDHDPTDPRAAGPAFDLLSGKSGPKVTSFPNFSDDFRFHVELPRPSGTLTVEDQRKIGEIRKLLNDLMPAWCESVIFTNDAGFILDTDLLDVTVF